jgi:hypothetical protein
LKKKELVIIDLTDHQKIKLSNQYYIKINTGDLIYDKNCKNIELNINNFFNKQKKTLLKFLKKLLVKLDKINNNINPIEMEIFNLRHDKSNFIERIMLLENLSKFFNSKNFKIKKLITDNPDFAKTVKLNFKDIKVSMINGNSKVFLINPLLSFINYFIKLIILSTFFKLTNFKKNKETKEYNITLFPLFFKNGVCKIYKNNFPNLNFLLGDETQLNNNLRDLIQKGKEINKLNNVIPAERNITYYNLIKIFFINLKQINKFNYFLNKKIIYQNLDVSTILKKHLVLSFLNRIKLSYYDESIKKTINSSNSQKINYYMFEYSFGFYLSRLFREISKTVKTKGYQHGIFTKKLMWLDILDNKNKKVYLPDIIISNLQLSRKAYSKYLNKNNIFLKRTYSNEIKVFKKITSKNSKKVLAILGLHDFKDNMQSIIALSKDKKYDKCKFFLKLHPKLKSVSLKRLSKNISIIKKIPNKSKYQILISQSSSLLYNLMDLKIECQHLKYNNKINIL